MNGLEILVFSYLLDMACTVFQDVIFLFRLFLQENLLDKLDDVKAEEARSKEEEVRKEELSGFLVFLDQKLW